MSAYLLYDIDTRKKEPSYMHYKMIIFDMILNIRFKYHFFYNLRGGLPGIKSEPRADISGFE